MKKTMQTRIMAGWLGYWLLSAWSVSAQQQVEQSTGRRLDELSQNIGRVIFLAAPKPEAGSVDRNTRSVLTLRIDPSIKPSTPEFRLTLQITTTNDTTSATEEPITLAVNYTRAGKYTAKAAAARQGAPYVRYTLVSLQLTDAAGSTIPVSADLAQAVGIDQELQYERYRTPALTEAPLHPAVSFSTDNQYAILRWDPVSWATGYELEYSFSDNYTGVPGYESAPDQTPFHFRHNSTRLQLTGNSYTMPMVYESGYVVWRVRAVGLTGNAFDRRVEGAWSFPTDGDKQIDPTGTGRVNTYYFAIHPGVNLQADDHMNWRYEASFAENGRRHDDMTYLDGSLRERQKITNVASENILLATGKIYDHAGQAAVVTLPVPIIDTAAPLTRLPGIAYQALLQVDAANHPYTWQDFEQVGSCLNTPQPFGKQSGAGRYYSDNNALLRSSDPLLKQRVAHVPDAGGYPFSQQEYEPDQSGRLQREGAPGAPFHLTNGAADGHEKKYFYSAPSQDELDRVFGTDAGPAGNYAKTTVVDENHQASISIKNSRGKEVLAALTGETGKGLTSVAPSGPRLVHVNLIGNSSHVDETRNAIESAYELVLTAPTKVAFTYSLTQMGYNDTICSSSVPLCLDCVYQLTLQIEDDCGKSLWSRTADIGNLNKLRTCENGPVRFAADTAISLGIGAYRVKKLLEVSKRAVDTYIADFLSDACWDGLIRPYQAPEIAPPSCQMEFVTIPRDCNDIRYLPMPAAGAPTPDACPVKPPLAREWPQLTLMLEDISPGGQYGALNAAHTGSNDLLSVFNERNQLWPGFSWRNPVKPYREESGRPLLLQPARQGTPVPPEQLPFTGFLAAWNASMAWSLLPLHPEYFFYEWDMRNPDVFAYKENMLTVDSWAAAQARYPDLFTASYDEPDHNDPVVSRLHAKPMLQGYMKDVTRMSTPPSPVPITMAGMSALAAAGFSKDFTPNERAAYLAGHTIYSDNALKDLEWRQFRTLYLFARDLLIAQVRQSYVDSARCCLRQGTNNCEIGPFNALIAAKERRYPDYATVRRNISTTNLMDPQAADQGQGAIQCPACNTGTLFLAFLNNSLHDGTLFVDGRLFGPSLAGIATAVTDSLLAAGRKFSWHIVNQGRAWSAEVRSDAATTPLYTLSLAFTGTPPDWHTLRGFACLAPGAMDGQFSLNAYDQNGTAYAMTGGGNLLSLTGCPAPSGQALCCPVVFHAPTITVPDPAAEAYRQSELLRIDSIKRVRSEQLRRTYIAHCLAPVEASSLEYNEQHFAYTLKYYDAAGNLYKVVPPAGVAELTDPLLDTVRRHREQQLSPVTPAHRFATVSAFTTLDHPFVTTTPDGGDIHFNYDELGRPILRQTAIMASLNNFQYTLYDRLSRVYETGVAPVGQWQINRPQGSQALTDWLAKPFVSAQKQDVTYSFYDHNPQTGDVAGGLDIDLSHYPLHYQQNRLAATLYRRFATDRWYSQAFFYGYNIEGNITELVQDLRRLDQLDPAFGLNGDTHDARIKETRYRYGLITKKIESVWYQPHKTDEYIRFYDYDADNRLTTVRTTNRSWESKKSIDTDASWQYYLHGPIASVALGQDRVQASAFTYTSRGWLKSVNDLNIGADATGGPSAATGYQLQYFAGDYQPVDAAVSLPDMGSQVPGLFDGKITLQVIRNNALAVGSPSFSVTGYTYDNLGRLLGTQDLLPSATSTSHWSLAATDQFASKYAYDLNGNLTSLLRNDQQGRILDKLTYGYANGTNLLDTVVNLSGATAATVDKMTLYDYDPSGHLLAATGTSGATLLNVWSAFDKPLQIEHAGQRVLLSYNAMTDKTLLLDEGTGKGTYYVNDLQGQPLAIYDLASGKMTLTSFPIYGDKRLGVQYTAAAVEATDRLVYERGAKAYELADHLGNVIATASDRRLPDGNNWKADLSQGQAYYAFGLTKQFTSAASPPYRFGYGGKEKVGFLNNNTYDYGARYYDAGISRWLQEDPQANRAPGISPYVFCTDNPISLIDPDGREPIKPLVGTAAMFGTLLKNSTRGVGNYTGEQATSYLKNLGNTEWSWKQGRPLPTETGYFNWKKGRYIYTEQGGWLDMSHFMFYAGRAYSYKQEKTEAESLLHSLKEAGITNSEIPVNLKIDAGMSPVGKAIQDGYHQELSDQLFAKYSAYSYEDLPSDKLGAEFGANYFNPKSKLSFGKQLRNYLRSLGATDPKKAPNYDLLPTTEPTDKPSRTNHSTTPVYTKDNP